MANSVGYYNALLGKLYDNGTPLPLRGGINYIGATVRPSEFGYDVEFTGGGGASTASDVANDSSVTGATVKDALDTLKPFPGSAIEFFCDCAAASGGDGSRHRPFNSLRDAITAAPTRDVCAVTIHLAPVNLSTHPDGYFDGSPIAYTDKRLSIQGTQMLNESPTPPTFGVHLAPHSSDGSNLLVEIIRTNSNIAPTSTGILVMMQDAHCEALVGTNGATYLMNGTNMQCNVVGSEGTTQGFLGGQNCTTNGFTSLLGCDLQSSQLYYGGGGMTSTAGDCKFRDCFIGAQVTSAAGAEFWDCTFPADASAVVISAVNGVKTDLATFQRGVLAGATWPSNTTIVDINVPLVPVYVGHGTASQSAVGNPAPTYGTNIAGDLFLAHVTAHSGALNTPSMPAGWTKKAEKVQGTVLTQVWTRDTRSTGGESGSVTVTVSGANSPTQACIHTFRGVSTAAFYESGTVASATGSNPTTIAGPSVTPVAAGRLAVLASVSDGTAPTATAVSGATNASWVDAFQQESGLGCLMDLQVATSALGNAISGGTMTMPGSVIARIAFALVGTTANVPVDGGTYVPTTRQVLAGTNLTGGGDLSADRTLSLAAALTGIATINGAQVIAPTQATLASGANAANMTTAANYHMPASTTATASTVTCGATGAATGACLSFSILAQAHNVTIADASGTALHTVSAGEKKVVDVHWDTTSSKYANATWKFLQ